MEQVTERTIIRASSEQCFKVAVDFAKYPTWAAPVKEAKIVSYNDSGLPLDVEYKFVGMGRSTVCTLRYSYDTEPMRLAWRLQEGDLLSHMSGEYEFLPLSTVSDTPLAGDTPLASDTSLAGGKASDTPSVEAPSAAAGQAFEATKALETTEVIYRLSLSLKIPLTGFVKRRAESRILRIALDDLKAYVESSACATF